MRGVNGHGLPDQMREPDDALALLRVRLEQVLASGDPRLVRLAAAETSVDFHNVDAPEHSVTLLLDRKPPALAPKPEPAEITIELNAQEHLLFALGRLPLPTSLHAGRIPFRGPVRKYLAVHPVLRAMLAELDRRMSPS